MRREFLLLALIALSSVFLLPGCFGPQGEPYLVPDKADGYAVFKPSVILKDQDFIKSMDEASRTQFEETLRKSKETYGVDLSAITKVTVFINAARDGPETYAGIIIEGTFDKEKLIGNLKKNGTVTEEQYDGTTIYIYNSTQSETAAQEYVTVRSDVSSVGLIAFVTDKQLVYGTEESVKDCIDVKNGRRKALSDGTLDRMSKAVDPEGAVLLSMKVPSSWTNAIAQSGSAPYDTTSFSKATYLSFSYSKTGPSMSLKSAVLFQGAGDAQKSSDVLQGLLSMARGFSKSGSASEKLLKDVKVSSNGEMLSASLEVTKETLDKLQQEMKEQANPPTVPAYSDPGYGTGGARGIYD